MWSSKFAILTVFLTILSLAASATVLNENSLAAPYTDESESLQYWDLTGSAELGGSYIRLTTDDPGKYGGIWNNLPCMANSWEFQTHFHIHGKGVNLNGDGMALWYVRDTLHSGPVFGSKDHFSGLAIFIDTFENRREPQEHPFPYICAMINNGSMHYENAIDGWATLIGGCHVPVRNLEVPTKIAVSYIEDHLSVYFDVGGFGQWRICFIEEGVHLPTGYFFGASASTSDFSDNHDVISISTLNLDSPEGDWIDKSDVIPRVENFHILEEYVEHLMEEQEGEEEDDHEVHEEEHEPVQRKREVHEEEHEPVQHKREIHEEEHKPVQHKREVHEEEDEPVQHKRKVHEEDGNAEPKTVEADSSPPSTSLFMKLIYVIGASIIILFAVSMFRKYSERRRERMHKRLF